MGIYRNWFLASRPWSLTMTVISIIIGSSLAAVNGPFNWLFFALTVLAGTLVHTAANLINDYYDVKNLVDSDKVSTAKYRPHPLLEGKIKPSAILIVSIIMFLISSIIGIYLVFQCGLTLLWMGIAGIFLAISYTAPPFKYKYAALGEIGVFLSWGPLMVGGSYFIQAGFVNWPVLVTSVPIGLLVVLVVLINNIRDLEDDKSSQIYTLPITFSRKFALNLFTTLIIIAYLWVVIISVVGPLSMWSLLVLVSAPMAIQLIKKMNREVTNTADSETAKLDTLFGILLVISIILEICIG